MIVQILNPEKELFKGEVSSVKLPGKKSPFEILNNHANIVSSLSNGNLELCIENIDIIDNDLKSKIDNNILFLENKNGGIIKLENNRLLILLE